MSATNLSAPHLEVMAVPDTDAYLEVRNLSKTFAARGGAAGQRVEVLRDIDLTIGRHEMVSVIGPSGSGKTTLLRMIAGLEKPDVGVVSIEGSMVHSAGPDRAVVFQQAALLPWASAIDNVCLGLRMKGMGRARGARASDATARAGRPSRTSPPASQGSSPAACSSGSPWPVRWCWSPRCCCSTSPSRILTRSPADDFRAS